MFFFLFADGSKTRIRRAQTDLQVAFFATRSQTQTHMGNLQNVVFDHVETNVGNGYDPYNGLFRAPEAGTYVFAATMVTYNNHSTDYGFFKNTRGVTRLWVNGASNSGDTASQTVILSLNKGDDVTIKHVGNDKTVQGHHYCVFSGFLLFHNETVDPSLVGK